MIEIGMSNSERIHAILAGAPEKIEKVHTGAINSALATSKKTVYKAVTAEYAIENNVLDKYTKHWVRKVKNIDQVGEVWFSGKQIPLYKYSTTSPKNPSHTLPTIAGQKVAAEMPGAFIQRMPRHGHVGIFERADYSRETIHEVLGSSLRSMAQNEVVMTEVYKNVQEHMDDIVAKQISKILRG